MFLGDYGADVIKIEHPRASRPRPRPRAEQGRDGLWFKALARNKRLVTLDLSKPAGARPLPAAGGAPDVVLENFRPGTLERWGSAGTSSRP